MGWKAASGMNSGHGPWSRRPPPAFAHASAFAACTYKRCVRLARCHRRTTAAAADAADADAPNAQVAPTARRLRGDTQTLITWNVASLRSIVSKEGLPLQTLVKDENPAVLCLQETKLQESHARATFVAFARDELGFPYVHFNSSRARKGYSGTAIFSHIPFEQPGPRDGIGLHEADCEGRAITVRLGTRGVSLTTCYVPNSGAQLARLPFRVGQWDPALRAHLEAQGPLALLCGDFNVAPQPDDVWGGDSPANLVAKARLAGFTVEERDGMQAMLSCNGGMVDVFREMNPRAEGKRQAPGGGGAGAGDEGPFTFWDYRTRARARNRGWRIDGWLASRPLVPGLVAVRILDQIMGSDHCPVALDVSDQFFQSGQPLNSLV